MGNDAPTSSPSRLRLAEVWPHLLRIYQKEICQTGHLKDHSPKGWGFAALRVISNAATVFPESRVASRAAALSFSSLLGLGPLIAITVLVAGFASEKTTPIWWRVRLPG